MKYNNSVTRTIITSTLLFGATTLFPLVAFAQPKLASQSAEKQDARLAAIKTRADSEIEKRLTSLQAAQTKITAATKLSSQDKTTFSTEIQKDITDLTTLKAKIDADTDLTTLKADAKTIFTDFRVYAVFLPQVHELAAVDAMGVTADNLTTLSAKLQTRIQEASSAGNNVTQIQTWLTDMNAKIADAKTQYAAVETEIASLTPASYPATSTLQDARSKIKTGSQDLKAAFNDAKQIINALKGMKGTKTSTPSATPTQ